jgi:hypothetical protein
MRLTKRTLAIGAGLTAGLVPLAYPVFLRRWCLTWGARDEEVAMKLPGDELLPGAGLVTTRAITIDAAADAIWPWLVQMGSGRGGAYTYDWIENLFGLNMHSAGEVLPEFQDLKAGDELPMGPRQPVMKVEVLDPQRALAFRNSDGNWAWIFALLPEAGSTRLISRNRVATTALPPAARLLYLLFMEPGSLVMERKMLLGIKTRAERLARSPAAQMSDSLRVSGHRRSATARPGASRHDRPHRQCTGKAFPCPTDDQALSTANQPQARLRPRGAPAGSSPGPHGLSRDRAPDSREWPILASTWDVASKRR